MATQAVLPFPCRKSRSKDLAAKLNSKALFSQMNPEKSSTERKTLGAINNLPSHGLYGRSIMSHGRQPRKIFGDEGTEGMTGDDVLDAIFKLSPLTPEHRTKENMSFKAPKNLKTPSKTQPKSPLMSPTRAILSPIRALSLNSPCKQNDNEKKLDAKRSKVLQLKLARVSMYEGDKVQVDETPLKRRTKGITKQSTQLNEDETPTKPIISRRVTRSARKAQKLRLFDDEEETKENTDGTLAPSPRKKTKPSPKEQQKACRNLLLEIPEKVEQVEPKLECVSPLPKPDDMLLNEDVPETPITVARTKKMLQLHKPEAEIYQQTKHALHSSVPDELVGREREIEKISNFISSSVKERKSGSLYISGAPGTGKSACLMKVLNNQNVTKTSSKQSQVISVNCMSMRNSTAIYTKIATELGAKSSKCKTARTAMKYLESTLTSEGPTVILLLDEMDQLDSKHQEVLYTIFEWPSLENSRLVLIGIANALDLTDRILPRLQSRSSCKPTLINFRPYTKDQIVDILESRIKQTSLENGTDRVIDSMAVQFCARKVAAVAGDARKALDVCRRAVEMVETSVVSQHVLSPSTKENGQSSAPLKKVGLPQIAGVISGVYQSSIASRSNAASSNGTENEKEDDAFPLQQKLAICTLILLSRSIKSKEVTLGKLHEAYCKICKKRQVTAVGQSEFTSLLQLIETRGIISTKTAKQVRLMKISLSLQEKDVEYALQDKTLLSSILQEGLPK